MILLKTLERTIFFYFFITLSYRIMGKREVGQLGIIDLIVSILIAELVAISIENVKDSIFFTIIPISALVGLEILLAYFSLKSKKFKRIIEGDPITIINNGKINYKEMIRQRYTLDDLLLQLRQSNIKNISDVEYAVLENNGKLSIFKYNLIKSKTDFPLPLIVDGCIQNKTLLYLNKDKNWLNSKLIKYDINIENVFYAFYKKNKFYLIKNNEVSK